MLNEFDLKACEWDNNPVHAERSSAIAGALQGMVPLKKDMKALEFGAGTGLLSFLLKSFLKEITLIDTSVEMIHVIQGKIKEKNILNMKPVLINLEKEDFAGEFDIIYNQMVFHHVENIDSILQKFHELLIPGGYLAIADLYPEDGSFHGEGFTGHQGFDPGSLTLKLEKWGFRNIEHQPCYSVRKNTDSGQFREFPLFLMVGSRR
jgi:tRNA (cmo5U34)-methyltransferase